MKRWAVVLVPVIVLAACSSSSSHTLNGTLTLQDTSSVTVGEGKYEGVCIAAVDSGYTDIDDGAQVTVTNSKGKIIGASSLHAKGPTSDGECVWKFAVDGIPDSDFYKVEVAHRGGLTFSKDEMTANHWKAQLTLG
jgi:hypothetical protein